MGYSRAGFEVVGVDIAPQPHYPFKFVQADVFEFTSDWDYLTDFDAVHASPPCQDHSPLRHTGGLHGTGWMLDAIRRRLAAQPAPWVIENVPGATMRPDYKLCGCMLGLPRLRRERWFETSWHGFEMRAPCYHAGRAVTVAGHGAQGSYEFDGEGNYPTQADRRAAMGIGWMNRDELAQAIPPAYTEHIGAQLLAALEAAA